MSFLKQRVLLTETFTIASFNETSNNFVLCIFFNKMKKN